MKAGTLPASLRCALVLALSISTAATAAVIVENAKSIRPVAEKAAQAQQRLSEANNAMARGDFDAARTAFEEARKLDPNSPAPLVGLAELARIRNDLAGVQQYLGAARQLAPENLEVLRAWGRFQFARGNVAEAEIALLKVAERTPSDVLAQLDLGELYLQGMRRPADAEKAFRRATELAPGHAGAHFGLGMALVALGRQAQAADALSEAARLAPGNPLPQIELGRLRLAQRDTTRAISAFQQALAIQPELATGLEGLGDAYMMRGDYKLAEENYTKAAARASSAQLHFKRGNAAMALKRYPAAEDAFAATIRADEKFAAAHNNLAWVLVQRNQRLDQALAAARRAQQLEPNSPAFQDTLGSVYLARGEVDAAIAAFRNASQQAQPPSSEYFYNLGIALARKGDRAGASTALRRALQIDPEFSDAKDAKRKLEELKG